MNATRLTTALALPLCLFGCKHDTSLVDVIENHPDEFPPPFLAITPPSAASALGLSPDPAADTDDPRRTAVLASARCFLVTEGPDRAGLSSYSVTYELSKDLRAELNLIAAEVGVSLDAVKRATLELSDLSIQEARLVPDPDGGCDFSAATTVEVFTRQIVVGRVALDFGVEMTLEPGVEVPISGAAGASVGVEGGWTVKSATTLSGENIVIAAKPEPWRVEIASATHELGPTPQANEYEVPGTSARVSVISYDANGPSLTVQVNTSLNQDADARPEDWATLGHSFELTLDKRQVNLLPAPGNRAITVRWTRGPSPDDPEISVVGLELQSMVAVQASREASSAE